MRTGAIFARGSCRALKWMLIFGVLSVLGSAQALAQPEIKEANYGAATSTTVTITLTERAYVNLTAGSSIAAEMARDFAIVGGTTGADDAGDAGAVMPIGVGALPTTRFPGALKFTLRFGQALGGLKGMAADGPLALVYVPDADRAINATSNDMPMVAGGAVLVGVGEPADLALKILPDHLARKAMRRGQPIAAPIELPRATGGDGGVLTYALTDLPIGLTNGQSDVTKPATIIGAVPNIYGTWTAVYSVTEGDDSAFDTFEIRSASNPATMDRPMVVPNGANSVKVTWNKPEPNNDPITRYEMDYRIVGAGNSDYTDDIPGTATSHVLRGLAPGRYSVIMRAQNSLSRSRDIADALQGDWSPPGEGSTGAVAGAPTIEVAIDPILPEDRDRIPVIVTVRPPAGATEGTVRVTLSLDLLPATTRDPETDAEIPTTLNPSFGRDVGWDSPSSSNMGIRMSLTFSFQGSSSLESLERMVYLNTHGDDDAEDEKFRIGYAAAAGSFAAAKKKYTPTLTIDDAEVQVYELELPYAVESSGGFKEGYGGTIGAEMRVVVDPVRTVAKSFVVELVSEEDATDYGLNLDGSPHVGRVQIDLDAYNDGSEEPIRLIAASNDGDRVDDTITLRMFETSTVSGLGEQLVPDIVLTVADQHKLPKVSLGTIKNEDGETVTSLMEGETGTVELLVDRGRTTDAVPDNEPITVTLQAAAASEAGAQDYRLPATTVTIPANKKSGTFKLEVLAEDDDLGDEELVLQAEVKGAAANGAVPDIVDLDAITLVDATDTLVWAKTEAELQAVIYPAKEAGMGADMMFTPGEMIEIASPGSLFNSAEGVTLSYTAKSDMEDVATVAVSGSGMVTVTAQDMAGVMAHITITARASMAAAGARGLPQTDPSEASIIFPVEVGLEALSFTLMGPPEDMMMNLVEGGMGGMVTATANRAVTAEVTINLMRDRAMSTADDMDFMAEAITIEAGMMSGTTMVMAEEDDMMENEGNMPEELVLYGMAADNAGEVTGQVKFYIWDAAVPALPLIAQLLLGLLLAIGGYRRYLRR